jgi:hypothetical protein
MLAGRPAHPVLAHLPGFFVLLSFYSLHTYVALLISAAQLVPLCHACLASTRNCN